MFWHAWIDRYLEISVSFAMIFVFTYGDIPKQQRVYWSVY